MNNEDDKNRGNKIDHGQVSKQIHVTFEQWSSFNHKKAVVLNIPTNYTTKQVRDQLKLHIPSLSEIHSACIELYLNGICLAKKRKLACYEIRDGDKIQIYLKYQIYIKGSNMNCDVSLQTSEAETVGMIKEKIKNAAFDFGRNRSNKALKANDITLKYKGKELMNNHVLGYYGIHAHASKCCVLDLEISIHQNTIHCIGKQINLIFQEFGTNKIFQRKYHLNQKLTTITEDLHAFLVSTATNIERDDLRLSYHGRTLKNRRAMKYYGISDNDTIVWCNGNTDVHSVSINIKKKQSNDSFVMKLRPITPIAKIKQNMIKRNNASSGLRPRNIAFFYKGEELNNDKALLFYGISDGDTIIWCKKDIERKRKRIEMLDDLEEYSLSHRIKEKTAPKDEKNPISQPPMKKRRTNDMPNDAQLIASPAMNGNNMNNNNMNRNNGLNSFASQQVNANNMITGSKTLSPNRNMNTYNQSTSTMNTNSHMNTQIWLQNIQTGQLTQVLHLQTSTGPLYVDTAACRYSLNGVQMQAAQIETVLVALGYRLVMYQYR
eukprot:67746_1